MSKRLIISLLVLTFSTSFIYAGWGSETRLTIDDNIASETTQNNQWCIAADGSHLSVVWYDAKGGSGNWEIYTKRLTELDKSTAA